MIKRYMATPRHQIRTVLYLGVAALVLTALTVKPPGRVSREDVERAHGLVVPVTAARFQQRQCGIGVVDRGILSLFELPVGDTATFIKQLKVTARKSAVVPRGNPLDNDREIWSAGSSTFVPGNKSLSGLKQTWKGAAKPIEMLSCKPRQGDWLHVEIWEVEDRRLIKLYTDWN
jgi:hypothetical protein